MKLTKINKDNFLSFCKKSVQISEGLYFKIDLKENKFKSSVYSKSREVYLIVESALDNYFEAKKTKAENEISRVGIITNLNKVLDIVKSSPDPKITIKSYTEELYSDLAQNVKFESTSFKIDRKCIHPTIPFVEIPEFNSKGEDMFSKLLDKSNLKAKFKLSGNTLKQIKKDFFPLDDSASYKIVDIKINGDKLSFKGESWEYYVEDLEDKDFKVDNLTFKINKSYFDYLESDTYNIELCSNKAFFTSEESSFILVFARSIDE